MSAANPSQALGALLRPLCSSDEDTVILAKLCESVQEASDTTFRFKDHEFNFLTGAEIVYTGSVPRSFSEIAGVVQKLVWDGGGPEVGYVISSSGESLADGGEGFGYLEDEEPDNHQRLAAAGGVGSAFCYGQNWTLFDPTRQLKNGEPAFGFISHEEVNWVEVRSADDLNYKQIFLRMISDAMCGTDYLPELYC